MKDEITAVISALPKKGITFADARYTSTDNEVFYFEKGNLKHYVLSADRSSIGIRVLKDGCWGFSGTNDLKKHAIEKAAARAIENAQQGALFKKNKVKLKKMHPIKRSYAHIPEIDPFSLAKAEKLEYLLSIAQKLEGNKHIIHNYLFFII